MIVGMLTKLWADWVFLISTTVDLVPASPQLHGVFDALDLVSMGLQSPLPLTSTRWLQPYHFCHLRCRCRCTSPSESAASFGYGIAPSTAVDAVPATVNFARGVLYLHLRWHDLKPTSIVVTQFAPTRAIASIAVGLSLRHASKPLLLPFLYGR
jgi:hypothetical protein